MIEDCTGTITQSKVPWNDNLFKVDSKSENLNKKEVNIFHTFTMKGVFLVKRAHPIMEIGFFLQE